MVSTICGWRPDCRKRPCAATVQPPLRAVGEEEGEEVGEEAGEEAGEEEGEEG